MAVRHPPPASRAHCTTVFATPSLRFPLQAGGTAAWFPSRSGGNLEEGAKSASLSARPKNCRVMSLAGEGDKGGEGYQDAPRSYLRVGEKSCRTRVFVSNECTLISSPPLPTRAQFVALRRVLEACGQQRCPPPLPAFGGDCRTRGSQARSPRPPPPPAPYCAGESD
jgi:hypothetical protein